MVRRFYITGGNNVGDPAVGDGSIKDPFFIGKTVSGVFKEGFRYYEPGIEWNILASTTPGDYDTVNLLNGIQFAKDEVFIVEVSQLQTGTTCGDQAEYIEPYLPDILKCIVARVNSVFENRDDDPFSVHYERGIYSQVGNDRMKNNTGYLMVWLMMPFIENSPKDESYYADAICDLIIATTTEANYTQQQREEINFFPRLIPVYHQLKREIKREVKLDNCPKLEHGKMLLPYWGGGDVSGPGAPNLWKNNVDAIKISGLKLKIKNIKCCTFFSSF